MSLVKFIEMLYAVVVGIGFGELPKSPGFKYLLGEETDHPSGWHFLLFTGAMMFVITDYVVYFWLAGEGGEMYKGNTGGILFLADVFILSLEYYLISISCSSVSVRKLLAYLITLLIWHAVVCLWYVAKDYGDGHGLRLSVPMPHIIRAGIYACETALLLFAVRKNWFGFGTSFERKRHAETPTKAVGIATVVISTTVILLNIFRFMQYHERIFGKK
jgi:succinate dehydrogenase hydrophobic anchor subunit